MRNERQTRIGFLSRASKGKLLQPGLLASLSAICQYTILPGMLTGLQDRDLLLDDLRRGYREAKNGTVPSLSKGYETDKKEEMFNTIACFADCLEEHIFLVTKESEFCGAVELPGINVLRHCAELLERDGDAVMALSKDHKEGFLLDFDPDTSGKYFELTVWGSRWPVMILSC